MQQIIGEKKMRKMTDADRDFLATIQTDMDDNLYMIVDTKVIYGNEDGDSAIVVDHDGDYPVYSFDDPEPFKEYLTNVANDYFGEETRVEIDRFESVKIYRLNEYDDTIIDFFSIYDLEEWLKDAGEKVRRTTVDYIPQMPKNPVFFTKKAAEQHLHDEAHHYSERARIVPCNWFRNPELEKVVDILRSVDWKKEKE